MELDNVGSASPPSSETLTRASTSPQAIDIEAHQDTIRLQLTIHSCMRERYQRLKLVSDLVTLLLSVILVSTAFVDPIGAPASLMRILTGSASVLLTCWTVLQLRLDWGRLEGAHEAAVRVLLSLKSRGRAIEFHGLQNTETARHWSTELYTSMEAMPTVGRARFLALLETHVEMQQTTRTLVDASRSTDVATRTEQERP